MRQGTLGFQHVDFLTSAHPKARHMQEPFVRWSSFFRAKLVYIERIYLGTPGQVVYRGSMTRSGHSSASKPVMHLLCTVYMEMTAQALYQETCTFIAVRNTDERNTDEPASQPTSISKKLGRRTRIIHNVSTTRTGKLKPVETLICWAFNNNSEPSNKVVLHRSRSPSLSPSTSGLELI